MLSSGLLHTAKFYDIIIKLYIRLQEKEFLWNLLLGKMQTN